MNDTLIDINELKKSLKKYLNKVDEKIKFNLNISKFVIHTIRARNTYN